jgi:flagellar hook assembly protein FlgD
MANYPNPFNSNTIIPFYLKHKNPVQLTIYNLRGELIAKLTDDYFTSGYHSITWDGRDQSGRLSPAGVYFAEIRVEGQVHVRKMMYLK